MCIRDRPLTPSAAYGCRDILTSTNCFAFYFHFTELRDKPPCWMSSAYTYTFKPVLQPGGQNVLNIHSIEPPLVLVTANQMLAPPSAQHVVYETSTYLLKHTTLYIYVHTNILLPLLLQFKGFLSSTSWVSRYQTGKTSEDLNEAREDGVLGRQWKQKDHMQTICTLLQTDNHTNAPSLNFYRPDALPDAQPTVSEHWRQYIHTNIWLVNRNPQKILGATNTETHRRRYICSNRPHPTIVKHKKMKYTR